ncbi:MAG: bifunctional diaminohydroxyphosphoribosylaminopyrimidine deaminase/5-amino-6-(5-phosphoribosylamino)uracil reductase RibD [Actinomycetota bacterium]|nr:bifunctional diaminohydroxyphosphoribosylaminopyrimidine deaminase/5-amino-6-(5-phosphoribosylamino)uracil reductase RibD [Actinomycetota bacterium]
MHEHLMDRALELARRAPFTSPNPKVGCVIARNHEIIAEGYHRGAGLAHAEREALSKADSATGATAYVTLEPCTHHGRTSPCAPTLVSAGISRVVIATLDPDERVAGGGVRLLSEAGVEVLTGVREREARALNAPYNHHRLTGRSYVSLKLALSLDGRLAAADGTARWISGPDARRETHRRRHGADAVVVGSGTAVTDDPSLTVRDVEAARQPARVLIDASGRTPPTARLFAGGEVIVATTDHAPHEAQTAWKEAGAEVLQLPGHAARVDLDALIVALGRRGWLELYFEGGARLATSLLRADLVDRLDLHMGPVLLGRGGPELGELGVSTIAEGGRWRLLECKGAGDDVMASYERDLG